MRKNKKSEGEKRSDKKVVIENEVDEKPKGEKSEELGEEEVKGYTFDQFIDKNSLLKRTKKQILNESNPKLPDYIKPPYPIFKKIEERDRSESI